jgi:putative tryptophan/tyrosine transport system substrate-binding protein
MRRRDFISLLCGTSVAWLFAARAQGAQQTSKVYRIAFVDPQTAVAEQRENPVSAGSGLFEELRRLGYVEGRNLVVEQYSSEKRAFRNPELARAVVERNPDAIVAITNPMVLDFKAATSTIPIVGITADPIALGIVSNLARPGGNITGVSVDAGIGMWSKRLELLRAAAPKTSKAAFLGSRAAWDGPYGAALREAAQGVGISLVGAPLAAPFQEADYRRVLAAAVQEGAEALVISDLPYNFTNRRLIVQLASEGRLPTIYPWRGAVEIGGLMAYFFEFTDIVRQLAGQLDLILKGAKPGEIPIWQPTRFLLSVNLKAAKTLGLTVPVSLLATADEVIE